MDGPQQPGGDETPTAALTPAEVYRCLLLRPDAGLACYWLHILLDDPETDITNVVLRPASVQVACRVRLPTGLWADATIDLPLLDELPDDDVLSFRVASSVSGVEPRTAVEGLRVGDVPFFREWRATHHPRAHE